MKILALFTLILLVGCSSSQKKQYSRSVASKANNTTEEGFQDYCLNFPIGLRDARELPSRGPELISRAYGLKDGETFCEFKNYRVSEITILLLDTNFKELCPAPRFFSTNEADQKKISNSSLTSAEYTDAVLESAKLHCSDGAPR